MDSWLTRRYIIPLLHRWHIPDYDVYAPRASSPAHHLYDLYGTVVCFDCMTARKGEFPIYLGAE